MKQIIVFAGTTEGRLLSEWLSGEGLKVLACVATEYGSLLMKDQEHLEVRQGRLTRDEMKLLFQSSLWYWMPHTLMRQRYPKIYEPPVKAPDVNIFD